MLSARGSMSQATVGFLGGPDVSHLIQPIDTTQRAAFAKTLETWKGISICQQKKPTELLIW